MIETVFKVPIGRRFASVGKGLRPATVAICIIQHGDMSMTHGVGILYPDIEHLYFKEIDTRDPRILWRAMYAVSKISCLSDEMLGIAIAIADGITPLGEPHFVNADIHLQYGYNARILREETLAQEPPANDIKKIVLGFNLLRAPINDPFAKTPEKEESASFGMFPQIMGVEMQPLSLAI